MSKKNKDKKYRLKLRTLRFVSAVDTPAQETATARLLKRSGNEIGIDALARVVKVDEPLGLVFGWTLTSRVDGEDYFDLQGDAVDQDSILKAAMDFMSGPRETDAMHDEKADGTVVFCMPMDAAIAKAFDVETATHGLMVAIKPSPEVFAKFQDGTLRGFSIQGTGEREEVKADRAEKLYVNYYLGDRVRVLRGKEHMADHVGRAGTVTEIEQGALGVLMDGETTTHRWYVPSEVAPLDPDEMTDSEPMGADPPATAPTETEKATTAKVAADKLAETRAWVFAKPIADQISIAKLNPGASWSSEVLESDAAVAHFAEVAKREQEEIVSKALETADAVIQKAHDRLYKRVDEIAAAKGIGKDKALLVAMTQDQEGSDAYEALSEARHKRHAFAAAELAKGCDEQIEKATAEMERLIESLVLTGWTAQKARAHLRDNSETYQAAYERVSEAREKKRRAAAQAPIIERELKRREAEKRQAEEEREIIEKRDATGPATAAFYKRAAELAKAWGCDDRTAVGKALAMADGERDPVMEALYPEVQKERRRARRAAGQ